MEKVIKRKMEVGTLKLMVERVMSYIGMINFVMILYLYVKQNPMGVSAVYWLVAISVALPILTILDWIFVYPSTLSVSYGRKNKEFQELRQDIKNMQTHLTVLDERWLVYIENKKNEVRK